MTLTIKDSPDTNGPGKPGATSQNSENKSAQSPRSNPVCLELGVTIRSLPTEAASLTQPIREEGRTVIVFDNGAVLRCKNNLPIGQTVILSNPSGRDVVCRVVAGHNLPSVKGYVEVEFMEAVSDFWSIHQDAAPAAGTVASQAETPLTPPPATPPRAAAPIEEAAKPASAPPAGRPTFSDISSLMDATPSVAPLQPKSEPARPAPQVAAKSASDYSHADNSRPTSLANWDSLDSDLSVEKPSNAPRDAWPSTASTTPPSRDFMSKGLMAYEKPGSASGSSIGRTPMIVGVAAIVLAAVSGVVFFMHRSSAPVAVAQTPSATQAPASNAPSPNNAPATTTAPQAESSPSSAQPQLPAQSVSVDQGQAPSALAPVPAVATSPVNADSGADSPNSRRQEKKPAAAKQAETASARRPSIPSLKLSSPSAPAKTLPDSGQTNAPMTDIAAVGPIGGTPSASLLTSAGRTSNPPAPPPSAAAPAPAAVAKTVRDPKLISSVAAVYPATARQTNVQGSVTVAASVSETGKVVSATALAGPILLRQAAVDAVKQWKYSPGLVDGKPAPSQVNVRVEFRLN